MVDGEWILTCRQHRCISAASRQPDTFKSFEQNSGWSVELSYHTATAANWTFAVSLFHPASYDCGSACFEGG